MIRPSLSLLLAFVGLSTLHAQAPLRVTPEAAESHLIRRVEPVYPAFAKAAGLEGVVRFEISISTFGQLSLSRCLSGPPSLREAASEAVGRFRYRPFEKDGSPVAVTTLVNVVFTLPKDDKRQKPVYPAQRISVSDLLASRMADSTPTVSKKLRGWLQACATAFARDLSSSAAEREALSKEWLDSLQIVELPVKKPGTHLYFAKAETRDSCGATGNCQIELVEEDESGVHGIASESGWGYYTHFRPGSVYPDIFIPTHHSGIETGVAGYVNSAGFWGLLYCGVIRSEQGTGTADIEVCQ